MMEELPTGRHLSRQAVASNFAWLTETPPRYEALSFKLLVPAAWRRDRTEDYGTELTAGRLLPLAALASPRSDAFLQVQATPLNREVTAEHWLRHFLMTSGYNAEKSVILSIFFADCLASFSIGAGKYLGRFAVRVHGDSVFLLSVFCEEALYDGMAELLGLCVASFQPLGAPSGPSVEEWLPTRLGDLLSFSRPASWAMRVVPAAPAGKSALDFISIVDDVALGMMRVKAAAFTVDATLDGQIRDAVGEYAEAGMIVNPNEQRHDVDLAGDRFTDGRLVIFNGATEGGAPQELWVIVFRDKSTLFTISLLTPDRKSQFLIWAENRRALDIVTETLR